MVPLRNRHQKSIQVWYSKPRFWVLGPEVAKALPYVSRVSRSRLSVRSRIGVRCQGHCLDVKHIDDKTL